MITNSHLKRISLAVIALVAGLSATCGADNPFLGGWGLTLPTGAAGWLGVEETNGQLEASLLWGGGSVLPLASAKLENGALVVTRHRQAQWKDESGMTVKTNLVDTITATLDGDAMKLTIAIRGIYEVQVFDSYGKPLDSHNMGAIYSRIKPTVNAEKPAGEWQTFDITYVKRHATVVLNGIKIIDNQPVLGPTGGALWPEVDRPGPIYLQGDHTGIEYRNIFLRPVVN